MESSIEKSVKGGEYEFGMGKTEEISAQKCVGGFPVYRCGESGCIMCD